MGRSYEEKADAIEVKIKARMKLRAHTQKVPDQSEGSRFQPVKPPVVNENQHFCSLELVSEHWLQPNSSAPDHDCSLSFGPVDLEDLAPLVKLDFGSPIAAPPKQLYALEAFDADLESSNV